MLFHIFWPVGFAGYVFDFRNHIQPYDPLKRHITVDDVDHPDNADNVNILVEPSDLLGLNFGL